MTLTDFFISRMEWLRKQPKTLTEAEIAKWDREQGVVHETAVLSPKSISKFQ